VDSDEATSPDPSPDRLCIFIRAVVSSMGGVMATESQLKVVLENLRNLMTCVSLITLAAAACRFHQHLELPWWLTVLLAGLLVLPAGGLLLANAAAGIQELRQERRWLALAALVATYVGVIVLLIHAVPAIGAKP